MKISLYQINKLVTNGDSETLEFKETTGTIKKAMQSVCAMLNGGGGHVLSGIDSKGKIVGQEVGDKTFAEVSNEIRKIEPVASPSIESVPVAGCPGVIALTIKPGSTKPYIYKGKPDQRIGSTTYVMKTEEYERQIVERKHSEGTRWENRLAKGWTIDDLDMNEVQKMIEDAAKAGRMKKMQGVDLPEMLRKMKLLKQDVPLRAATVLFGKSERIARDLPQCTLSIAIFSGTEKVSPLDDRQFYGNAFELMNSAEVFLSKTIPIAGLVEKHRFQRYDIPLYPIVAVREAIVNAICHRDYSIDTAMISISVFKDRLEIASPGSLHFGLTPETFFTSHGSFPRNPLIARTFYLRGFVEEIGNGANLMSSETLAAGAPPPEIEDRLSNVTVKFFQRSFVPENTHVRDSVKLQQKIYTLLGNLNEGLPIREIHARIIPQINKRQVKRALNSLKEDGQVMLIGRGATSRWIRTDSKQ